MRHVRCGSACSLWAKSGHSRNERKDARAALLAKNKSDGLITDWSKLPHNAAFRHTNPLAINNSGPSNRSCNATLWYANGLAIDHGVCVGGVDTHHYDQSDKSKSGDYEQTHRSLPVAKQFHKQFNSQNALICINKLCRLAIIQLKCFIRQPSRYGSIGASAFGLAKYYTLSASLIDQVGLISINEKLRSYTILAWLQVSQSDSKCLRLIHRSGEKWEYDNVHSSTDSRFIAFARIDLAPGVSSGPRWAPCLLQGRRCEAMPWCYAGRR